MPSNIDVIAPARHASVVIGASSAIASAVIRQLAQSPGEAVFAISRSAPEQRGLPDAASATRWITCDYSDQGIAGAAELLQEALAQRQPQLRRVLLFNGILHSNEIKPERRIEQLSVEAFNKVINTNALLPLRWLQALIPQLKAAEHCTVAALSARVGSISDNRLGGWYSYRASKAALNMLLQTASVELARRAPGVKLIAFHPGTTDTPLSKPFQKNVDEGKLFAPEFVAARLLELVDASVADGKLSYIDWDGKNIAF